MSSTAKIWLVVRWIAGWIAVTALLAVAQESIAASLGLGEGGAAALEILCVFGPMLGAGFGLWRSLWRSPYHEASLRGLPTPATVQEIVPTGWRTRHERRVTVAGSEQRGVWREFRLLLLVEPPARPSYQATTFVMMPAALAPAQGARLTVRAHPDRPDVVLYELG